jgi:hypothetical protein
MEDKRCWLLEIEGKIGFGESVGGCLKGYFENVLYGTKGAGCRKYGWGLE